MTRKERINQLIVQALHPTYLDVVNESNQHNVPKGAESHFKLSIVSEKFNGISKIARHRIVNNLLAEELKTGLHALSLHLYSPEEWQESGGTLPASPACRGGYHHG